MPFELADPDKMTDPFVNIQYLSFTRRLLNPELKKTKQSRLMSVLVLLPSGFAELRGDVVTMAEPKTVRHKDP